jgi:hypothetical protein
MVGVLREVPGGFREAHRHLGREQTGLGEQAPAVSMAVTPEHQDERVDLDPQRPQRLARPLEQVRQRIVFVVLLSVHHDGPPTRALPARVQ